jgi:hypothetical protein
MQPPLDPDIPQSESYAQGVEELREVMSWWTRVNKLTTSLHQSRTENHFAQRIREANGR